jgi:hypothetical protein
LEQTPSNQGSRALVYASPGPGWALKGAGTEIALQSHPGTGGAVTQGGVPMRFDLLTLFELAAEAALVGVAISLFQL